MRGDWENLSAVLEGEVVRLEPLDLRHEEGLFGAASHPEVWRWIPYEPAGGDYYPAATREVFHRWFEDALAATENGIQAAFATLDAGSGEPVGSTRFLALRPEHRGLLVLEHAFGSLGCVRVEFKTDARNERSRGALAALPGPDGERFVRALAHGSMEVELYAPRGANPQTPHTRDELYVVVEGTGTFVNGDTTHPFGPGDVLCVPAGVQHRFEDFTDDLAVWVVFYGPEGGEAATTGGDPLVQEGA